MCLLFAADLALAVFIWHGGREGPATQAGQLDRLVLQAKLLKADVQRGEKIKASLPQVGKDCDGFIQRIFFQPPPAIRLIVAELSEITQKAGLKTGGVTFQQKEMKAMESLKSA